ncbi:Nif3-like dinuclear metal center hexameric protein [Rothia sp. P7181]|uniref:Nif3-like dinuclear metal center hexameric protein n=1 Tax=unclassified Rothia (in: high G+C Gram-positive bacteria) TaxID=2689056 RepID=UPI003AD26A23
MTEQKIPSLEHVVRTFHEIFPPQLSESWDASGLITGRLKQPVRSIGLAVDATVAVAQEAVQRKADVLITHHPLLLRPVHFIADDTYKGEVLQTLIEGQCALLGAHTNVDSSPLGTNDVFMKLLGINEAKVLSDSQNINIDGHEHSVGIGRVGELSEPVTLEELSCRIAHFLPATAGGLRVAGPKTAQVQKIALCTGAGDSLLGEVLKHEADVYITADLRHHPASEFREGASLSGGTPYLIDCSHYASESLWLKGAGELLQQRLANQGYSISFYVSELNTDPWDFVVSTGDVAGSASTF